jgi:hypothetical protein
MPLADGRMLAVWVVAGDRSQPSKGMHFCISDDDGKTVRPLRSHTKRVDG